jgi:nitrogen-specific signal transduction histidine kinase
VIGTASIAEDITDRRNLEKQVLRTQRLESLGTLAGGIAHDLNNLLMPILMGAALLKRDDPSPRSLKAIENIETSVKRGRDLVRQVLLFARGGADRSREAVQLGDVVREVAAIVNSTFPKDINLEVSVAGDLQPVIGDPTQLVQVVLNLCVNARDAMPRGGRLWISALNANITEQYARLHGGTARGPHVVLEVTDTGEGIPAEILDRIFDPFFTTKEAGLGTGLGLSTVQGIVTSHDGFISVSSALGEGTTFTIHFPAPTELPLSVPIVQEFAEPVRGNGELILVVDDDPSVLSVTREALESFGYQVLTAFDGAEAIGVFAHRHAEIALVLTDMAMPVVDGPALIAALARIDPAVPVVVATGSVSTAYLAKIERSGVARILTKPFAADHLLQTIAGVLIGRRGS